MHLQTHPEYETTIPEIILFESDSIFSVTSKLRLYMPKMNILVVEFANSLDPNELAHNEPPHLDLYCLPSSLSILNICCSLDEIFFCKFADIYLLSVFESF